MKIHETKKASVTFSVLFPLHEPDNFYKKYINKKIKPMEVTMEKSLPDKTNIFIRTNLD